MFLNRVFADIAALYEMQIVIFLGILWTLMSQMHFQNKLDGSFKKNEPNFLKVRTA